jgi:hypothetical protein
MASHVYLQLDSSGLCFLFIEVHDSVMGGMSAIPPITPELLPFTLIIDRSNLPFRLTRLEQAPLRLAELVTAYCDPIHITGVICQLP